MASTNDAGAIPADLRLRLPSLTGMRFVAAMMVFMFHAMVENVFLSRRVTGTFVTLFYESGWAGVGFFFLLSGFVLAWTARPTDTAGKFWRRRFFKIYPNHVVTWIVAILLLVYVSKVVVDSRHALLNLLLVQSWFPQLEIRGSINGVSWSLSCEMFFYLMFPLLMPLISRVRPERLWAWAIGVTAAIVAVPVAALALPREPMLPMVNIPAWEFFIVYQLPPVRTLDFVLGMLLARIVMTGRRLPLGLGGAVALAIAAYALTAQFPTTYTLVAVMVLPMGLVIAAGAAADNAGQRTLLSSRLFVWLGEVSFAMYLWHELVLRYGHYWLGGGLWRTPVGLGVLALLFGVSLLLSWLLFTLFERPITRRFGASRFVGPEPAGGSSVSAPEAEPERPAAAAGIGEAGEAPRLNPAP